MSVFELSALPKLRRIGLVRVANLTDEAIYALGERHATLERIHLSYCDQISVMAVHFLLLKLHKLTHLSLTGVPAFRQEELQQFCREAPKVSDQSVPVGTLGPLTGFQDFSTAQRQSFCVFSGKGISNLRAYLTELFDRITDANVTDDTEYENEDDDTVAFQENDTPEPELSLVADDRPPSDQVHTPFPAHAPVMPTVGFRRNPRMYELAIQRERAERARLANDQPTIRGSSANRMEADNAVYGATSVLNEQFQMAGPSRHDLGQRNIADVLPIVEPQSPVDNDRRNATHLFNPDWFNAVSAQYHPTRHPNAFRPEVFHFANGSGTHTPDLNFAEIGHGRGVNGTVGDAAPTYFQGTSHQPYMGLDNAAVSHPHSRSPNTRAMSDPGTLATVMHSAPDAAMVNQDSVPGQSQFSARVREARAHRRREVGSGSIPNGGGEGGSHSSRGRIRSRIRNGLNSAENYLFGRGSPGPPGPSGLGGSHLPDQAHS